MLKIQVKKAIISRFSAVSQQQPLEKQLKDQTRDGKIVAQLRLWFSA